MIPLNVSVLSRLKVIKKHPEGGDATGIAVSSIDYREDGFQLIAAFNDDAVGLYNLTTGKREKAHLNVETAPGSRSERQKEKRFQLYSKKYGVGIIRFTHESNTVVHTSTKVDNTIRYLSLYDNKYLRYFAGHTDKVTSLTMSPIDDLFLSASLDKHARLWDLRTQGCQGAMQIAGRPVTSFDPQGLIFAVGADSENLRLYDLRSFDKGPFASFKIEKANPTADWTSLDFSPDGKHILLNTNEDHLQLVDAFEGTVKHTLRGHENAQKVELQACFTPDARHVCCGSSTGHVHMWNVETGQAAVRLQTPHRTVTFVGWNPTMAMMATADTNILFWRPP